MQYLFYIFIYINIFYIQHFLLLQVYNDKLLPSRPNTEAVNFFLPIQSSSDAIWVVMAGKRWIIPSNNGNTTVHRPISRGDCKSGLCSPIILDDPVFREGDTSAETIRLLAEALRKEEKEQTPPETEVACSDGSDTVRCFISLLLLVLFFSPVVIFIIGFTASDCQAADSTCSLGLSPGYFSGLCVSVLVVFTLCCACFRYSDV